MLANGAVANLSGTNTGDQTTITGNAGTVTNGVYTVGDQTIAGVKTFSSTIAGSITGNAATVTTNANLTGVVTSVGNATSIANGVITNAMLANGAVANLSGINTGDNAVNTLYSGLISNATHTGDVTGSTALTIAENAVTTSKIADAQITNAKIAAGAITDVKITDVAATKITGTVAVANGGNGLTSTPANGQIDIGNGAGFTRTTLTAGTGISVTNNAGSITIANTSTLPSASTGDMMYYNGSAWVSVAAGSDGQTLTFIGGRPVWTGSLPANTVVNAVTGKIWMDRNLGATQVATSSTDASAYGDLYQWGRGNDNHQLRTSSTTSTLSSTDTPGNADFILSADWRSSQNNNLWQGVNGVNNPCPSGYRIPTEAEWTAEKNSWSSDNAAGAFSSSLKLPMAGYRSYTTGVVLNAGAYGAYWSSTVNGTRVRTKEFITNNGFFGNTNRGWGTSVRCIKD
jgi:uncharacterized protein (TIGR02145 family)